MDHVEALKRQAAEKYLLGELSEVETEEFEAHYFECQECAGDVEAGALFVDNATAVFRETAQSHAIPAAQPVKPKRGIFGIFAQLWNSPMAAVPAFAALTLAALSGYQGLVVIPGLRQTVTEFATPRVVPDVPLFETTRGESVNAVPSDALECSLRIDPTWGDNFATYRFELKDSSGARRSAWEAKAREPGRPITIGLSPRLLGQGRYIISVSGIRADGSVQPELASYAFTL